MHLVGAAFQPLEPRAHPWIFVLVPAAFAFDDELPMALSMEQILGPAGFTVHTCSTGGEALAALTSSLRAGSYSARIPVEGEDEIADLHLVAV